MSDTLAASFVGLVMFCIVVLPIFVLAAISSKK